jgi:hypothetical protein
MVANNEISCHFEQVAHSADKAKNKKSDTAGRDGRIRERNKGRIVHGQAGMYPKRKLKDWGATEIGRGTSVGVVQQFGNGDGKDLVGL